MKKLLSIACIAFTFSLFGQGQQIRTEQVKFIADESNAVDASKAILQLRKRALEQYEYYPLNITLQAGQISGFIENACNGDFKSYVNFLCPDSNGVVVTSTGKFSVYEHTVGNVFDPKDSNVDNQSNPSAPRFSKFVSYTVDTIGVRFGYHRHLDSALINSVMTEVVDSLVFQFFNINQLSYIKNTQSGFQSYAYPIKANYNLPGLKSNSAAGSFTLPLTKAYALRDTTTGWSTNFFNIPVGITINQNGNSNSAFGYTMTYRPMVKIGLGDTLYNQTTDNTTVSKQNNYLSYFFSQNEAPSNNLNQTKQYSYFNNSFFVTKFIRYGQTSNGWTTFIPGNAYFSQQYVFAYYQVSTSNLAVKNLNKSVKMIEVYPNPGTENTEFSISLESSKNTSATVSVTDLTGKVVKTFDVVLVNGKNLINFSNDNLSKGMYLVNVEGGDFQSFTKLLVE